MIRYTPRWLATSVRNKLLAMALLPLLVVFPLLVLAIAVWSSVTYDRLLITKVRSDLAVARGYFDQTLAEVGSGTRGVARSQRLLQAGLDPLIADEHPEDVHLCRTYRAELEARHGLRFAPPALAQQFAFENSRVPGPCFGFHGPYNLPLVLDEATLQSWLAQLPDAFFRSRDARRLARALLARRMPRAAQQLIARRQAAGRTDPNTRLLGLAARALRWVA